MLPLLGFKRRLSFSAAALRCAVLPVIRVPMEMHDSEDENHIRFDAVEDAVGKAIYEAPTHVSFKNGPSGRIDEYVLDGGVDLDREIITEAILALLVIVDGLKELGLRLRVELEDHVPKRALTLANT